MKKHITPLQTYNFLFELLQFNVKYVCNSIILFLFKIILGEKNIIINKIYNSSSIQIIKINIFFCFTKR